jgi:hypothetical protein
MEILEREDLIADSFSLFFTNFFFSQSHSSGVEVEIYIIMDRIVVLITICSIKIYEYIKIFISTRYIFIKK